MAKSKIPQIKVIDVRDETSGVVDLEMDEAGEKLFLDHAMALIEGREKPHPNFDVKWKLIEFGFVNIIMNSLDEMEGWKLEKKGKKEAPAKKKPLAEKRTRRSKQSDRRTGNKGKKSSR